MKKNSVLIALGALFAVALLIAGLGQALDVHPIGVHAAYAGGGGALAMAVVIKYGTGSRDPASLVAVQGLFAAAELRVLNSQITITNGDSIASIYRFGEVPADGIPDPTSTLFTAAITGVTLFDLGLRFPNGGAVILGTALFTGQTLAAATSLTLAAAAGSGVATAANQGKKFWELAGLAANPGGNLEVYGTAQAAATATGVVDLKMKYLKGA